MNGVHAPDHESTPTLTFLYAFAQAEPEICLQVQRAPGDRCRAPVATCTEL
jgi:hypothetical protein